MLYPIMLSFRFDGKIKNYTTKQKQRVQHYQASITRNVKGTSQVKRKGKN